MICDVVEQINNLIIDRKHLKKENAAEVIDKLTNKRDTLKENFVLNMPFNYNDEQEFSGLYKRIDVLSNSLKELKIEQEKVTDQLNRTTADHETKSDAETDIEPLVFKSIHIKRQISYFRCLIKIETLKETISSNIKNLNRIKEDEQAQSLMVKHQKLDKRATDKLEQLDKHKVLEHKVLFEKTILLYKELRNLLEKILNSKCTNLIVYLSDLIIAYHSSLKSLLICKIEDKLKSISYPFISNVNDELLKPDVKRSSDSDAQEKHLHLIKQENENILRFCLDCLLDIELMPLLVELACKKEFKQRFSGLADRISNKSAIVEILAKPFETRFTYHFMGARKTNNYEKPEWYLQQVFKWIKGHDEWINSFIQPIFDNYKLYKGRPILIDFTNCLINLIKRKINIDLNVLLKNKFQFSHSVDELLLFDNQLKNYLKEVMMYDDRYSYDCLHILCENEQLFQHWISLERQVCQKKLDAMFEMNDAASGAENILNLNPEKHMNDVWSCVYSDIDKMKPPHCAESFMSMINAITDRFNGLPYQSKKLQFITLQIELINDFHLRICQIIRDEAKAPFGKIYLGALNAVNYIMSVLDEWKNSTFYIEMHYLKLRYSQFLSKHKTPLSNMDSKQSGIKKFELLNASLNESIDSDLEQEVELSKIFDLQFLHGESIFHNFHSLIDINGTLFDSVLSSYEKIKDEMMQTVITNCLWEIKTRSREYRREKWISMPLISDYYKVTLTQSAADMLISLKNLLFLLKDSLAALLFETILKRITTELDNFLFDEVLLKNQFNEGGISQFDHDFTKYFLPILNEFLMNKGDMFFRKTKEALILLKLKQGSSLLVKEILNAALHQDATADIKKVSIYNAKNTLKEFGVVLMNCEMAETILRLRLY